MFSKCELNSLAQHPTQSKDAPPAACEPPPDEAADGENLSRKQLIFLQMLIEQWKHYYEQNLPMTDLEAAA